MNFTKNSLTMVRPDDFHLHLRDGNMLKTVLPYSAKVFNYGLVMPNPREGRDIAIGVDVLEYFTQIDTLLPRDSKFQPMMTFKIIDSTTPEIVRGAKAANAIAGKAYPIGSTTHSATGISNFRKLYSIFEEMQYSDLVLCIHGEDTSVSSLYREHAFLPMLRELAMDFPKLRIVLEHVSTKEGVEMVEVLPANVAATIAIPHLFLTDDDVAGGKLHPHLFCKPRPKFAADRDAIRKAAMSRSYKFFFGSDSAPHPLHKKECAEGEAGIFSPGEITIPLLVQLFDEGGLLYYSEDFTSRFGCEFYRLAKHKQDEIEIIRKPWRVPDRIDDIVPLWAGRELQWQVAQ